MANDIVNKRILSELVREKKKQIKMRRRLLEAEKGVPKPTTKKRKLKVVDQDHFTDQKQLVGK